MVPIYKKWEVSSTRLQVIKHDKVVQLVCFFKDFTHGSCMNFALKSTDVFESHSKSGTYYVRIVDAKFALPKSGDDSSKDFVCLDIPQYPGEHDDITIGFDVEAGMFCASISFMICTKARIVCHRTRQIRGCIASVCQYRIENGISTEMSTRLMNVWEAGFPLFRFNVLGILVGIMFLKIFCDEGT